TNCSLNNSTSETPVTTARARPSKVSAWPVCGASSRTKPPPLWPLYARGAPGMRAWLFGHAFAPHQIIGKPGAARAAVLRENAHGKGFAAESRNVAVADLRVVCQPVALQGAKIQFLPLGGKHVLVFGLRHDVYNGIRFDAFFRAD